MNTSHRRLALLGTCLAALTLASQIASAQLLHRYSFLANAEDSVGTAHGTLNGTASLNDGAVVLDGTAGNYVSLPAGLLSGLSAVTIETWATLSPSGAWTRLWDFGATDAASGAGHHYLFLCPHSGPLDTRLVISDANPGYNREEMVAYPFTVDDGSPYHLAAVIDPTRGWAAIYVNGILESFTQNITIPLSAVAPDVAYLGRSVYNPDPYLPGSIEEVRIHSGALTSAAIAASFAGGPNTPAYNGGTIQNLSITLPPQMRVGGVATPELRGSFSTVGDIKLGVIDVALSSSAPDIIEVRPNGTLVAKATGAATITATLATATATATVDVQPAPVELVNRWSFNEPAGTTALIDSIGGGTAYANPAAQGANTVTLGNGQASFPGGATYLDGAYIDMPDYLFSSRQNLTAELWVTWNGPSGSTWQRFFDFGSSSKGDNPHAAGNGLGNFFLTPRGGAGVVRFVAGPTGFAGERTLDGTAILPVGQEAHVVCIYAPENQKSQLWVNGRLVDSDTTPFALSALTDNNCWLGLANWNDPPLSGSINEFRIYEGALTELEIALRRQAGPNALPADPGLLQTIQLTAPALLVGNPASSTATLLADFQNTKGVDVTSLSQVTFTSSDPNVFTAAPGGVLRPVTVGSADLVATFQGLSSTARVSVLAPQQLTLTLASPLPKGGPFTTAQLQANYTGVTDVTVNAFANVTFSSSDPTVATISAAGAVLPLKLGATTLTATYGGLTSTRDLQVATAAGDYPPALAHRYSFSDAPGSTIVTDSAGSAHGELINPAPTLNDFNGAGRLLLAGGAWNGTPQGGYVNLPNGLVSTLTSVTLEAWVKWNGPADSSWQRIFDFGRNSATDEGGNFVEDQFVNPGVGYMFVSPRSGANTVRFAIKQGTGAETPVLDSNPFPVGVDKHVAVAYDVAAGAARLYVDGVRVQTGTQTLPLSVVEDLNVYLGRAQWTDPYFNGEFNEFRIYNGALSDETVAASFAAGPDTLPNLTPAPSLSANRAAGGIEISWPESAAGYTLRSTPALGQGASWSAVPGTPQAEGGRLKLVVPADGSAAYYRLQQ